MDKRRQVALSAAALLLIGATTGPQTADRPKIPSLASNERVPAI